MDSITSMFIVYRYDSTTGTFTVPPGGGGFYYFSVYLDSQAGENSVFDIEINGEPLCSVELDQQASSDEGQASCNAAALAMEGLLQILKSSNW